MIHSDSDIGILRMTIQHAMPTCGVLDRCIQPRSTKNHYSMIDTFVFLPWPSSLCRFPSSLWLLHSDTRVNPLPLVFGQLILANSVHAMTASGFLAMIGFSLRPARLARDWPLLYFPVFISIPILVSLA